MNFYLIFLLSFFVGYYIVLNVSNSLHAPLIALTNAISSIIIVPVITLYALYQNCTAAKTLYLVVMCVLCINIVGGLLITNRMVNLFEEGDRGQ